MTKVSFRGFKMSPAPKKKQPVTEDFAHKQMKPQVKGTPHAQDCAEEEGKV